MKDTEVGGRLPCDECPHSTCGACIPHNGQMVPVSVKSDHGKNPCLTCEYGTMRMDIVDAFFEKRDQQTHVAA